MFTDGSLSSLFTIFCLFLNPVGLTPGFFQFKSLLNRLSLGFLYTKRTVYCKWNFHFYFNLFRFNDVLSRASNFSKISSFLDISEGSIRVLTLHT